jgi:hypothetical protein
MDETKLAAIHEAAHCAAAYHFGQPIRRVEIRADGSGSVFCDELKASAKHQFAAPRYRALAWQECIICYAGACGELMLTHTAPDLDAWKIDASRIRHWLAELQTDQVTAAPPLIRATRAMLKEPRTAAAVRAIAARLLERGSLSGDEVHELCRSLRVARNPAAPSHSMRP